MGRADLRPSKRREDDNSRENKRDGAVGRGRIVAKRGGGAITSINGSKEGRTTQAYNTASERNRGSGPSACLLPHIFHLGPIGVVLGLGVN